MTPPPIHGGRPTEWLQPFGRVGKGGGRGTWNIDGLSFQVSIIVHFPFNLHHFFGSKKSNQPAFALLSY